MNAGWAAVLIGSVLGGGGMTGMVWHAAKLAAVLEELVRAREDHETRLRALERR